MRRGGSEEQFNLDERKDDVMSTTTTHPFNTTNTNDAGVPPAPSEAHQKAAGATTGQFTLAIPEKLVRTAYLGTIFDSAGFGRRVVQSYEAELQVALAKLREHAREGGTQHLVEEQIARYVAGYQRRVIALLHSESRCISPLIAGPSNFPVRRMEKRAGIVRARLNELDDFRDRAMQAAGRVLRPDLRPIMAGDADAVERLATELHEAERKHVQMKAANVAIRKYAKAGTDHQVAALMEQGFTEAQARKLLVPDQSKGMGFAHYELTNSSANIRRMKQRLAHLQKTKAAPVVEVVGSNGVHLEDDPPANRVRLFFPGKPDEATRSTLKRTGFRWTPSLGAWQAYRNHGSLQLAKVLAGVAASEN